MPSTAFWSRSRTERVVTGPETIADEEPPAEENFDSIEERLAFAEIALAGAAVSGLPNAWQTPQPDDPFAAFPD